MKIQMLLAADYATVDQSTGKFHILGAFTRITARQFPVVHRRLALAVKVTASSPTETTKPRKLDVLLEDEDGKAVMAVSFSVSIPRDEHGNRDERALIIELNNLKFPHPGGYDFRVNVEGKTIGVTRIELVQSESPSE